MLPSGIPLLSYDTLSGKKDHVQKAEVTSMGKRPTDRVVNIGVNIIISGVIYIK